MEDLKKMKGQPWSAWEKVFGEKNSRGMNF